MIQSMRKKMFQVSDIDPNQQEISIQKTGNTELGNAHTLFLRKKYVNTKDTITASLTSLWCFYC